MTCLYGVPCGASTHARLSSAACAAQSASSRALRPARARTLLTCCPSSLAPDAASRLRRCAAVKLREHTAARKHSERRAVLVPQAHARAHHRTLRLVPRREAQVGPCTWPEERRRRGSCAARRPPLSPGAGPRPPASRGSAQV
eukprot:902217-Rhodomonas_salina.1